LFTKPHPSLSRRILLQREAIAKNIFQPLDFVVVQLCTQIMLKNVLGPLEKLWSSVFATFSTLGLFEQMYKKCTDQFRRKKLCDVLLR
jgi:hypothetical protein